MHQKVKLALGAAALAMTVLPNTPANAATFDPPVVVSPNNVSEPGIEIAPDGTLYVHGPAGVPVLSTMWRSDNDGTTWSHLLPPTRTRLGGGDIDMAIQPDGKLAFTDLWLGSSSVGVSSNKGNAWLINQVQGVVVQDRQWVQTTGRDVVYHVTHQLAAGLVVSKSLDGGLTYPIHVLAASTLDQGNCICPPGFMIAEAGTATLAGTDDKVGVAYSTSTGVRFARSVNGGTSFLQRTIDPTGGASTLDSFPVVANAGGNKLVAVWTETTSSTGRIRYSLSSNWGDSWSAPATLVSTGTSVFAWVDARADKIAVSLYHTTTANAPDKVANSALWYLKYVESTDGGSSWGSLTTADTTSVKSGPICVDGLNCSADRELGDFQMVALDADARANISYVRSIDGGSNTEVRWVRQAS